MPCGSSDDGAIVCAAAIHQPHLIANSKTKHFHCMMSFLLRQFTIHPWVIKETLFLHLYAFIL